MTLSLPSEYEAIVKDLVDRGAFASPEEAVKHALDLLAAEQQRNKQIERSREERRKRAKRFRQWAESNPPAGHFVDDSRESIY